MTQALVGSRSEPPSGAARDRELPRLDVYRAALEFQRLVAQLLSRPRLGAVRNQLDRSSTSIALNIAEGAGRYAPADKARHYLIARGSALECVAILDVIAARCLGASPELRHGADILDRIIAMLTRLSRSMQERARRR